MDRRIYYLSNYDNEVHNIHDHIGYVKINNNGTYTGAELYKDDFVYDAVVLHTLREIVEL